MACTSSDSSEITNVITIIALIATIISSHIIISKQTRKNKTAKWIDEFRSEIAKFFSLSIDYKKEDIKTIQNLAACGYVILMLLDEDNTNQDSLITEVQEFGIFMTERFDAKSMQEYKNRIQKIKDLAKIIIKEEEKKL